MRAPVGHRQPTRDDVTGDNQVDKESVAKDPANKELRPYADALSSETKRLTVSLYVSAFSAPNVRMTECVAGS